MAEGLTDRGIAERLYLTLNTVETHIRHIIGRLELPSTPADNRRVQAVLTFMRAQ
jgi:DNA-binding NarL/FixJ family response regulator